MIELTAEQIADGWVAIPEDCMEMPLELAGVEGGHFSTLWEDGDTFTPANLAPREMVGWDRGTPRPLCTKIAAYRVLKPVAQVTEPAAKPAVRHIARPKTKLSELCAYDELSEGQYRRFIEARGGCSCHLSPPCNNCFEPATADELLAVGFEDFIDDVGTQVVIGPNDPMIRRDERPNRVPVFATKGIQLFGAPRNYDADDWRQNVLTVAPIGRVGSPWGEQS